MGDTTAISWTDHTFNPWIGCARVSPGCQNCYAETSDKRRLLGGVTHWGKDAPRHITSESYWNKPLRWDREAAAAGVQAKVFCASQSDVFEDRPDLVAPRAGLFDLIGRTPNLIWQLLTKRPENVHHLIPDEWSEIGWPSNVWLGTTVEDQQRADERIPSLVLSGARTRFLSCEPLLGHVDLPVDALRPRANLCQRGTATPEASASLNAMLRQVGERIGWRGIGWVIVGGESGNQHRPMNLAHARNIVDTCKQYGVPVWFKQVGGRTPTAGGDLLDGVHYHEFPR